MDRDQEILEVLLAENKEITINIKIIDPEKAKLLLGTLYGKNTDIFGVEVQSWGFWDIIKANDLRIKAIKEILKKPDLEFLKPEES